jgi:acyl-CoA thioesterase-2
VGDFDADTALTGADGHFRARLSDAWEIWGPNGGYVASIALRAAGAVSRFGRPASFVGHFLSVAAFDDIDVEAEVLRATRVADSVRVTISQGERSIIAALVWVVDDLEGLVHDELPLPDVPLPRDVPSAEERIAAHADQARSRHPFWDNFEERPLDWLDDWEAREPADPVFRTWIRFRPRATFDDPFVDAARSLLLLDTMGWPAAVRAHAEPLDVIAPNIDLAVHFHRLEPASEYLYVEATAPVGDDGLIGASSRVWSESGRLLASGSQQLLCRPVRSA